MALTVDKDGTPIKVTGTTSTLTEILDSPVIFIKFVYWLNPTTAGHLCTLKNKHGREITALRCEGANESQIFPIWTSYDGIYCDDMDSGTLYVYIS